MKLKYYLRGLGVGIVAMGLIMIVTSLNNKTMSDEEVIQRARELGMEFSTTLSNMKSEETENAEVTEQPVEDKEVATDPVEEKPADDTANKPEADTEVEGAKEGAESTEEGAETDAVNTEAGNTDTVNADEGNAEDAGTGTDDGNKTPEATGDEEYVILTISPGDGSDKLSIKAAELGLVESSSEFDNYLISNGYANRLRVGSYEVKVGSSFEEIVNAIFN